ncbi:MAG: phosphoribosyltransferase family protein [Myxococcaceae bacterium]
MPTRSRTTRPPARPAAPKARKVEPKKTAADDDGAFDEFSAAGGMPTVPQLPQGERERGKQKVRELAWGEFDRHVQALARSIAKGYRPDMVVGLVHGGVFVGGALASALKAEFIPLRVTHRSRDTGARASEELPREVAGKKLLVVDDVAASGDSLSFTSKLARAGGARAVKTAALVARPGRFEPDYVGFTSEDFIVFPWDYQDVVEDRRFDTGEFPAPVVGRKG